MKTFCHPFLQDLSQGISVDWNGQPLDCRLRPAGFYANPANSQVYARCTPDGTFIPMRCPQTTVFDQALGQCVFPFQLGQGQSYGPGQGGVGATANPTPPNFVNTDNSGNSGNGAPNYAVQNGIYGQGGGNQGTNVNSVDGMGPNYTPVPDGVYSGSQNPPPNNNGGYNPNVNSLDGSGVNYAVQGGTYGQVPAPAPNSFGQNPNFNSLDGSGVNYAVQGGTYGQIPAGPSLIGTNPQGVNSLDGSGVNYAVQGGTYGQIPVVSTVNSLNPQGVNSLDGSGVNYAVQGGSYGPQATNTGDGVNFAVQNGVYGQPDQSGGTSNGDGTNYAVQSGFYDQTTGNPADFPGQSGPYGVQDGSSYQDTNGGSGGFTVSIQEFNGDGNAGVSPNYAVQGGLYGISGQGGGGFTQGPPIVTSQIRPYTPDSNFYTTTPQQDIPSSYFTNIGGHNVPVGTGYGHQIGYSYNTDTQQNSGSQQPDGPHSGGGLTIGITISGGGSNGGDGLTPVVCIGRTGTFADRTNQCRSYTICRGDGTSEIRTCSGSFIFNEQSGVCDLPQNTNCFANTPGITQPVIIIIDESVLYFEERNYSRFRQSSERFLEKSIISMQKPINWQICRYCKISMKWHTLAGLA